VSDCADAVALGAREEDEVRTFRIVLPVHPRRTQPEEPLDFGSLVVRVQIEVHPVAGPATVSREARARCSARSVHRSEDDPGAVRLLAWQVAERLAPDVTRRTSDAPIIANPTPTSSAGCPTQTLQQGPTVDPETLDTW
jgi:cell division septation protein DedD